jgi:hypothetical protein
MLWTTTKRDAKVGAKKLNLYLNLAFLQHSKLQLFHKIGGKGY